MNRPNPTVMRGTYVRAPYRRVEDLPEEIRDDLPRHAQEIYLQAYNTAWREYQDLQNPRFPATREAVAHKVALWAVENEYEHDVDAGLWLVRKL